VERYRIHADATLYYCTFSVADWLPVFVSERPCQIITDSLTFCHQRKQLGVDSFVIMPTHLHLIVFDREWDSNRLQLTLTDFRKFTGRQLAQFCLNAMPSCFGGALAAAAGDDREHRFWQPTCYPEFIESERFHGQKRDYCSVKPHFKGCCSHGAPPPCGGNAPTERGGYSSVPSHSSLTEHYLHDNPRRKGLVLHPSHWRWSSARSYETGEDCGVPLAPVMW